MPTRRLAVSVLAALALTTSTIGTALAQPKPIPNCPAGYLRWSFTDQSAPVDPNNPEMIPLYEQTGIGAPSPKSITVEILYPPEICMSYMGNPCSAIVENPGRQTDNPLVLHAETMSNQTYDGNLNWYTRDVFIVVDNPKTVRLLERKNADSYGSPKHGCYKVSVP